MDKKTQMIELFLHDKPTGIIMSLKGEEGKYASVLSKETDCTYTHTLKILTQMQALGMVDFEKKGRIKFVKLTAVGVEIAEDIDSLVNQLGRLAEGKVRKEKKPGKKKAK
jgi:DNA-binding transcriptional ArsR family regulator